MSGGDALRPGARLGRYRLLERVGAGGMAEVFAARTDGAEGFSRVVAIKVVHADASDEEHLLPLIDEARVASSLSHPNVVQVYELDRHGDGLYMVMEFLDGWPLDRLLKLAASRGVRASDEVVAALAGQLLDALAYAHTAPAEDGTPLELVHRDIKPSNLMIDALGLVKVVDFGIARASNIERRTATGVGKGTPAYMSPEQLYGRPVDPRSDVFAAGCVLYELATGQRLFEADAFGPLILRRTEGFTPADQARLEASSPLLAPVIARAVQQEPEDRWDDAAAMAAELRRLHPATERSAVRGWLTEVLGGDPSALRRTVAALGEEPRGADAVEPTVPVAAVAATLSLGSTDRPTSPLDPTRLVPPTRRAVTPWLLGGAALVLGGLGIWGARSGPRTVPAADPEPALVRAEAPTFAVSEPTPAPPPEPTPAPPLPQPVAAPDPTPTPPRPDLEPTPAPVIASAPTQDAARGTLKVVLVPSSGFVEVDGGKARSTPADLRLAPGEHAVALLDKERGLLGATKIRIASGETSVCTWHADGGTLTLKPSPFGDPCEVVP